jgi:hypothetical protein
MTAKNSTVALILAMFALVNLFQALPLSDIDPTFLSDDLTLASSAQNGGNGDDHFENELSLNDEYQSEIDEVHRTCMDLIKHNFWKTLEEIERKLCNEVILYKLNHAKILASHQRQRRFFAIQLGQKSKNDHANSATAGKGFKYGK